jgi:hypothetical protein
MRAPVPTEAADERSVAGEPSGELREAPGASLDRPPLHPALRRALDALEEAGISWALLRGESELDSADQEVDLLVARSDLSRLEQAVAPLAYIRIPSQGHGSHSFFVGYDETHDSWIKLDVVKELAFGRYQELRLAGVGGCLARRQLVGNLVLLAARDAFWTLLLHCLLDAGACREPHRRSLVDLAAQATISDPLARALEHAVGEGWASTLIALVKTGDWTLLEDTAFSLRAAWLRRRPLAVASTLLRNQALRRAGRFPPLSPRGVVLQAEPHDSRLAEQVAERWPLPHRLIHVAGSPSRRFGVAARARWEAARGRLVFLDVEGTTGASSLLGRVSGASDFRSVAGLGSTERSFPAATAAVWRRFAERART